MLKLLRYDCVKYPADGSDSTKKPRPIEQFSERELIEARKVVATELEALRRTAPPADEFVSKMFEVVDDTVYLPTAKAFVRLSELKPDDACRALNQEFALAGEHLAREAADTKKVEQKVQLLTAGYQQRFERLSNELTETHFTLLQTDEERVSYETLLSMETIAVRTRVQELKGRVSVVKDAESALQKRYRMLTEEYARLQKLLQQAQS